MTSLLILPLLLAVASQVNCGLLHREVSSGFNPSISSGLNSRGYGSDEITSSGSYGLSRDGLSGARSVGSSRFSSEAGLINAGRTRGAFSGGLDYGITGAEFRNAAGVGNGLGLSSDTVYSRQTQNVNIPARQPAPVSVNRPISLPVSIRRPVDVPRPVPTEVSTSVRFNAPRSFPVDVARPCPDPVSQPLDVNVPVLSNVQSDIGSLPGDFGFNSERGIELGRSGGLELSRGFGRGNGIIGGIESGFGSGEATWLSGASSASGYSDAYTSGWRPNWTYKSNGGYRY